MSPPASDPNEPVDSTAALRASFRVDVSDVVPLPGRFEIAVDLVVPATPAPLPSGSPAPSASRSTVVLACLPGGFLSRRYFDLEIDGRRDYSFAEAMAERGFVTLAFDHVGVGDSSKPDPIEGGYALGVEAIARANQAALESALERLAAGDIAPGIPPLRNISTIGVGHSMGSALAVEQQALARAHRALLLFSFTARGTPAFLDEALRAYADEPVRTRRELGEIAQRAMGTPYPARAANSGSDRRAAFGVGTAPPSAEEALQKASTNLLALGGLLSMIPGGFAPAAAQIDVPVFILVGDHDLHDARGLQAELPASPDVEVFTLPDCWHCHFVANTRETIWDRVAEWISMYGSDSRNEIA